LPLQGGGGKSLGLVTLGNRAPTRSHSYANLAHYCSFFELRCLHTIFECTKGQVRQLKTALPWKIPPEQRQRIQMVLLRESGMTLPLIAEAMGVSLSTVDRAHMTYDYGGIKALKPRPSGFASAKESADTTNIGSA